VVGRAPLHLKPIVLVDLSTEEKTKRESGTNNDIILLLLLVQIIQLSKVKDLRLTLLIFYFLSCFATEMGNCRLCGHASSCVAQLVEVLH
jgi:hypothetical protein